MCSLTPKEYSHIIFNTYIHVDIREMRTRSIAIYINWKKGFEKFEN